MPEEQSVISGIQARYDHENTIPKTIDINPKDPNQIDTMINSNEGGYDVFNNYPAQSTQMRHLKHATVRQATDPGEGIDHYKKLFSFSKSNLYSFFA